jgi:hypothetical protein
MKEEYEQTIELLKERKKLYINKINEIKDEE